MILTNDRIIQRTSQPMEFRALSDDKTASLKAFTFGDALTVTAGGVPNVRAVRVLTLNCAAAADITACAKGMTQQLMVVRHLNGNATLKQSPAFRLQGGSDYTGEANAIHLFYHVENDNWQEVSRIAPTVDAA